MDNKLENIETPENECGANNPLNMAVLIAQQSPSLDILHNPHDSSQLQMKRKTSPSLSTYEEQQLTLKRPRTVSAEISDAPTTTTTTDLIPSSPPTSITASDDPSLWPADKEKIIMEPFDYIYSKPGKDMRSHLISAVNVWLKVPEEPLNIITRVIGMLHTASLLIDDIQDDSPLRRGVTVAHKVYGVAQTINSANHVYFVALSELLKLNNPAAIQIYTDELLNLHRGQGMDLHWRDNLICPSEADYFEMVGNKTGGLFRLAIKLMQCESEMDVNCVPLVNNIGLTFQILDDYKNLSDDIYTANKGLAEDLTEGKFSFPIIHCVRMEKEPILLSILKEKTHDEKVKKTAVAHMEKMGSFAYTRRVLAELGERTKILLEEVEAGREKSEGVRTLLSRIGIRQSRP